MKSFIIILLVFPLIYLGFLLPKHLKLPSPQDLPSLTQMPTELGSKHIQVGSSSQDMFMSWNQESQLKFSHFQDGRWQDETVIPTQSFAPNWLDKPHIIKHLDSYYGAYLSRNADGAQYRFLKSEDGRTWQTFAKPLKAEREGEFGFGRLFSLGERLHFIWIASHPAKSQSSLYLTILGDESQEQRILDERICDCCTLSVEAISKHEVAIAYRDRSEDEVRNIKVLYINGNQLRSIDLEQPSWQTNSCPMNGPALKMIGNQLALAWYTTINSNPINLVGWTDDFIKFETFGPINDMPMVGRVSLGKLDDSHALVTWVGANEQGKGRVWAKAISNKGEMGSLFELAAINLGVGSGTPQLTNLGEKIYLSWDSIGRKNVVMRSFGTEFFQNNRDATTPATETTSKVFYEPLALTSVNGDAYSLSRKKHKLLVFWATWCQPCIQEIPMLSHLASSRDELDIISINIEDIDKSSIQEFMKKHKINYFVGQDLDSSLQGLFSVSALPTSIMIDQNNQELWRIVGDNKQVFLEKLSETKFEVL